jgi:hypothetical protein
MLKRSSPLALLLTGLVLIPSLLMTGCSKKEDPGAEENRDSSKPTVGSSTTPEAQIKRIQDDPNMPAPAKQAAIAQIKAHNSNTGYSSRADKK